MTICVMSGIMTHSAIGAIEVERDLVVTVNLKQTMSLCQIYKCVYMYTYIYVYTYKHICMRIRIYILCTCAMYTIHIHIYVYLCVKVFFCVIGLFRDES